MRFLPSAGLLALLALSSRAPAEAPAQPSPSYQRHVTALFSRLGCNGGTCHGAIHGQNGFRLSLFGAEADLDRNAILREAGGRRLSFLAPDDSLLLRKATGKAAHGGGKRLEAGSFEYDVLRRWVAAGAPADPPEAGRIRELRVLPADKVVKPGERYALRAVASFADGSSEDVTRYCSFSSLDGGVAAVDPSGAVQGRGVGDTALIVRYRSVPAMALVLVPRGEGASFPDVKPHNFIDEPILAKLRRLNLPPAPLADDATFLRRASLDVAGELPPPQEVRDFLADPSPEKRSKKIDELLARPGHAALWTLKFCDLLKASDFGVYADALSQEGDAPRFQAWIRARLEENTPYDVLVARILLATGREGRSAEEYAKEVQGLLEGYAPGRPDLDIYRKRRTLDLYWQRRGSDGVSGALQVAHTFLGLRLECAQCHRHPHDVWQQEDLLGFANFFVRVRRVGFEGNNEKRFPEMAALNKRYTEEGKKLAEEVKKKKDTEGKKLDEEAKKAKADADRLTREIASLEKGKAGDAAEQLKKKKAELDFAKEVLAKQEKWKKEMADLERRAKVLPEVGRRLLQAEVRLLPPGPAARVTSPLGTQTSTAFRLPGVPEPLRPTPDSDPRELVVQWMRRPDNPFFARAIVNRVWAHYFGRGIVNPPDNLSSFNPPSHPELLRQLSEGFVRNRYDLRWLHRAILNSRTYQQGSLAGKDNAADRANYSTFPVRRLPAEVLLDALNQATGTTEKMDMQYYHWPEGLKTVEVPYAPRNPFVTFMLEHFGRPKRNAAVQCDCERDSSASVFQVLTLANHPRLWEKIADPAGRMAQILKEKATDEQRIEEVFLATVSRPPSETEREACLKYLQESSSPARGLQGILWALLNTREFLLQH